MRILLALSLLTLSLVCQVPAPARAAAYPEKPVNFVVPFPPGGGSDRLGRLVDAFLDKHLGKNFTFVYKPGGGTMIGTQYMATMPKDGYWMGTVNTPQIYNVIEKGAPFKLDSFDYIAQMSSEPVVLAAPPGSPLKSAKDFVALCKAKGTKVAVGIPSGTSGTVWYASQGFKRKAGIDYTPVPMQGGNDLNASLLGKHIDAGVGILGPIMPEAEKLTLLAVSGPERVSMLPKVPTFAEQGIPVMDIVRRLFLAPKGMPPERLAALRAAMKKVAMDPEFEALMEKNGFLVSWVDGPELEKLLKKEMEEIRQLPK